MQKMNLDRLPDVGRGVLLDGDCCSNFWRDRNTKLWHDRNIIRKVLVSFCLFGTSSLYNLDVT